MVFILYAIVILFLVVLLWFAIPVAHRQLAIRNFAARCSQQRAIVLTYDDGPSAGLSPRLADLLRARQVRATFFLVGRNVVQHAGLAQQLHREGHEIGNHTQEHRNAWKIAPWQGVSDLRAGENSLRALGLSSQSFRPPFGKSTPLTLLYALRRGLRLAYWTVDSRDSWARRPLADLLAELERQGGGVVLMHDFDRPLRGPAPEAHSDYLLELTEALIEFAARRGFALLRISDLFDNVNRGRI